MCYNLDITNNYWVVWRKSHGVGGYIKWGDTWNWTNFQYTEGLEWFTFLATLSSILYTYSVKKWYGCLMLNNENYHANHHNPLKGHTIFSHFPSIFGFWRIDIFKWKNKISFSNKFVPFSPASALNDIHIMETWKAYKGIVLLILGP